MPFYLKENKPYWSSYKLLESQLLRLSHSICFDDKQYMSIHLNWLTLLILLVSKSNRWQKTFMKSTSGLFKKMLELFLSHTLMVSRRHLLTNSSLKSGRETNGNLTIIV